MVIWDDHEVSNDYSGDRAADQNNSMGGDPSVFLRRRAAAYQVYFESMPLRRRAQPVGPDMLLYRALNWGRLAQFQFLDNRQHRSPRPCIPASAGAGKPIPDCGERRSTDRSMLGSPQERWLLETLSHSRARWNVLAQQTLFAPAQGRDPDNPAEVSYSSDGWDGAPASRDRIIARWRDARVSNPVVLGGDIHAFAAADVRAREGEPVAAPVFVGSSISSLGFSRAASAPVLARNPDLKQFDGEKRGYGLVDIRRDATTVTFRTVADARREDLPVSTLVTYAVENGRSSVQRG